MFCKLPNQFKQECYFFSSGLFNTFCLFFLQERLNTIILVRNHLKISFFLEPVNQLAERVLLGVKSKIQGLVTGNLVETSNNRSGGLDQLDVAGHVGLFVRSVATDY
ncbi:unnamed protein product [Schistosoma turkestanicum]|nr:unnamed protein product [Schistosoma turkestanicum]